MNGEDRDLLRQFVETRDQNAFGALVRRHIGFVYHSALRRTGDAHASEDITQRVFLLLARKAAKVSTHETITGWLHTTTRLETQQFLRQDRRRVAREREAIVANELYASEPARDWEKLRPEIDAALDRLDPADRDAVLLRFFGNQPFAAIGEQLGVTENGARMRVERALDKLNGILSAHKITSLSLAAALATEAVAASAPPALAAQVTTQALAGAALNAGTAVFITMTTSKIIAGTAVALVALGFGTAWYEANASRQTQTELELIRHSLEETRTKLTTVERQLGSALVASKKDQDQIDALEKELAQAKTAQTTSINSNAPAAKRTIKWWSNPEYTKLKLEDFRLSLRGRFQPFYDAMHLSPEQISAFEAIQEECQRDIYDIWAAAESTGLESGGNNSTNTAVARMTSDPHAIKQEKLKALLGEDVAKRLTDFDSPKTNMALTVIEKLAGNLYSTENPLTAAQGFQLRQIIAAHTEIVKEPMASDGKKPMYMLKPQTDWAAVHASAATFLSESQRTAFQNQAALEVMMRTMNSP